MASIENIKDFEDNKRNQFLRLLLYLSLLSYLSYIIFYIIIVPLHFLPAILTISIYLVCNIFALILYKKTFYLVSKILFLSAQTVALIVIVFYIFGPRSELHYYFLLFALIPLPLCPMNKKTGIFLNGIFHIILFMIVEFYLPTDKNYLVDFPHYLEMPFKFASIFISFVLIFLVTWLFYKASEEKALELIKQNDLLESLHKKLAKSHHEIGSQKTYLIKLNHQLETNLEVLTEKKEELTIANNTKDKFFSIISHDLRNPLTALVGLADLLQSRVENYDIERIKKLLSGITKSANNIHSLVVNLLSWSRTQLNTIAVEKSNFKINMLVEDVILLLNPMANEKQIELINNINCDDDVYADREMIKTVLRNITGNAIKFTHNRGKVSYSCYENYLIIEDTGIGIEKDKIDTLFQIDKKKSTQGTNKEEGSGLGLIISNEFLKLNNCTLKVESESGKGTKFFVGFPQSQL